MKAYVKNYRQSPRKVRLVADLVRGKSYDNAMLELSFLPKRASGAISKIIASAAANAENNFKMTKSALMVKEITVNQGVTLKRMRPRSRGMATRINKRTSNIAVTLVQAAEKKKGKRAKAEAKKAAEKVAKELKAMEEKEAKTAKKPTKKAAPKKAAAKKVTKK